VKTKAGQPLKARVIIHNFFNEPVQESDCERKRKYKMIECIRDSANTINNFFDAMEEEDFGLRNIRARRGRAWEIDSSNNRRLTIYFLTSLIISYPESPTDWYDSITL
jgi:hypothetical protein